MDINNLRNAVLENDLILLEEAFKLDKENFLTEANDLLFGAVHSNNVEMTNYFFSKGVTANVIGGEGIPAFHIAVEQYNFEMVQLFLNNGCDINIVDKFGKTALSVAIFNRDKGLQMIQLLIDKGINKTIKNNYGVSAEDTAKRFNLNL